MLRSFFGSRIRLCVALSLVTAGAWWLLSAPRTSLRAPASAPALHAGLAGLLAAEGLTLRPRDVFSGELPPVGGFGPLRWRPIFFAAEAGPGSPLASRWPGVDLYRAEIRLDPDGEAVDLRRLSNLTRTASAEEGLVVGAESWALWQVKLQGVVQGLLLLDARRDEREFDDDAGRLPRAMAAVTNRLQTGSWDGVGLASFNLLVPASAVRGATLRGADGQTQLQVHLDRGGGLGDAVVVLDPVRRLATAGADETSHRPRMWPDQPFVHWTVDTVRGLPWVGTRPITLLEKWVFTTRSALASLAFRLGLVQERDLAEQLGLTGGEVAAGEIRTATPGPAGPASDEEWPPPPVPPLVPDPQKGEGQWFPWQPPWLHVRPGAPPAFYKAAVTLPGRPPALAVMVAMDLRQLDLEMIPGLDTPWSRTGTQGEGRIARDPDTLSRAVAAFNGGFQTAHGPFGMMAHRELILDPLQKTATVATLPDGTVALGTWNNSIEVPEFLDSFRQNMPPLLEDGVWNPMHIPQWGVTIHDLDQVHTTRSALAYRGRHTLIYLWSDEASAKGMAEALRQAGCGYAVHLDINPEQAGFSLLALDPSTMNRAGTIKDYKVEAPSRAQTFTLGRFINRNGKDFFAMLLRRTLPERLAQPPAGFSPWRALERPELPESFLPVAASSRNDATGELAIALDVRRLRGLLSLGTADALLDPAPPRVLPSLTLVRPLAVIDFGTIDHDRPLGLQVNGRSIVPASPAMAALALAADGRPSLLAPGAAPAPPAVHGLATTPPSGPPPPSPAAGAAAADGPADGTSLRQACPLLVDGQPSPRAIPLLQAAAGQRHHALGELPGGVLLYLSSTADAAGLTRTLQQLGVDDALLLPDGPQARLQWLEASPQGLLARDPLSGGAQPLASGTRATRLLLDALSEPPRAVRLRLPDVELTAEQQQSQKKIQADIERKRSELMGVVIERYRANKAKAAAAAAAAEGGAVAE